MPPRRSPVVARVISPTPLFLFRHVHRFVQLALAVQHLHRHHLLHRDIKPSNIFLSESAALVRNDDAPRARRRWARWRSYVAGVARSRQSCLSFV